MSARRIVGVLPWFQTEISNALFKLSGAAIAGLTGTAAAPATATVTLAAHLLTTGDYVTFSGVTGTGVTALNDSTWGPVTVLTSSTYTFLTPLTGTAGGTIVQEKLLFLPAGDYVALLGANGQVEYDPGNLYLTNGANSGLDITWRTFLAASATGDFTTDGTTFRFRQNGTTATSRFSRVA